MGATFKQPCFETKKLKQFAADLIAAGIPATIHWGKDKQTVEMSDNNVNLVAITISGEWFSRQFKKNGVVRSGLRPEPQRVILLRLLQQHDLLLWPLQTTYKQLLISSVP